MIEKPFILEIFNAAAMQRWNDKIRPVELKELDKQGHKMTIAYFLGKFEEQTSGFSWLEIIEGSLFEFLERLVITDLKMPGGDGVSAGQRIGNFCRFKSGDGPA